MGSFWAFLKSAEGEHIDSVRDTRAGSRRNKGRFGASGRTGSRETVPVPSIDSVDLNEDISVATRARTFENQARAFDSTVHIVKQVAFAFGSLILGLACGLVWSTTSKTVSDSRVDIGLFRALGATKREIRRLFLGEAVLQGVLGTVFGMVLGWALAIGISHWVINFARGQVFDPEEALLIPDSIFSINLRFCLLLIVGAALVSLLAGLLPANRAANVDPVRALKRRE